MKTPEGQASFLSSILNIANMGVTLNPAAQLAYLIARRDTKDSPQKFCLDIGYRGLLYLATKDGRICNSIEAVVRDGDFFELQGADLPPVHRYDPFEIGRMKKAIIGAYISVKLPDGSWKTMAMGADEIEIIKQSSPMGRNNSGPWKNFPDQMYIKTVIKRAYKFWPAANENRALDKAVEYLNSAEVGEGIEFVRNKTAMKAERLSKSLTFDNDESPSSPQGSSGSSSSGAPANLDKVTYLSDLWEQYLSSDIQNKDVNLKQEWLTSTKVDSLSKMNNFQLDSCILKLERIMAGDINNGCD
jgi:phage RecT family recombinase